ncbi:hypothetical protein [Chryseobacterium sp.]|uniref:hypothetical protein n=1 Tax=Chryseobacterium sp. TaxID=1871047 RepID=UPI00289756CE|nr:hypothetical protein [Chryseobacterium sp.]
MQFKVLHNQNLLDFAIQHTGSVANAFLIAVANNMAVSDILVAGSVLLVPDNMVKDTDILNYYSSRAIQPATALQDLKIIKEKRGIGWMKVGSTFKVG